MSKSWEDRYKQKVLDHFGVQGEVDLATVEISVDGENGYAYSSWTFEDPSISVSVYWVDADGVRQGKIISGPEAVAALIRSF